MFYHAVVSAKKSFVLEKSDNIVLIGGSMNGKSGNTNTIKVEQI